MEVAVQAFKVARPLAVIPGSASWALEKWPLGRKLSGGPHSGWARHLGLRSSFIPFG